MKRILIAMLLVASARAQQPPPAPPVPKITPVTDAMLQNPDPNEWLMWRRTLNSWGFSPLDQIKKSNVKDLRMVWTHGLGPGNQEGTPLVHNGVMLITNPGPGEPGDESWGGIPMDQRWHVGTWMVPSYDPELNLVIIGTSVTIPAPKFTLAGPDKNYLFHNCTLALNADTGKIVWYYQHIVDHWDLDHPFERLLVDTVVAPSASEVRWINPKVRAGERRKVVTGIPGKTGVVYTLDRATGEFLWARPTVYQNVISKIDGATGAVTVSKDALFTKINEERFICPGSSG